MPFLKIYGDREVLAGIKTDSVSQGQSWSVDLKKALNLQVPALQNLKRILGVSYASGAGLEGATELYACSGGMKGRKIDLSIPLQQQGVTNEIYCGKPPPPPARPKPPKPQKQATIAPDPPQRAFPPPPQQQPQMSTPSARAPAGVALVMPPAVAPVDWDNFIDFWEARAEEEMDSL
eukprot:Hpha_TRINITY_DN13614_c0_g3::TRINITY_DN13614_c0_g3_i1::g.122541::m.122541